MTKGVLILIILRNRLSSFSTKGSERQKSSEVFLNFLFYKLGFTRIQNPLNPPYQGEINSI